MNIQKTLEDFSPKHFYEYAIPLNNVIEILKEKVRKFYYLLMLSDYKCPECAEKLEMIDDSRCFCSNCHYEFDPTLTFQKCTECDSDLKKKTFHYYCKNCNNQIYSKFCFEEKAFNKEYFAEMIGSLKTDGWKIYKDASGQWNHFCPECVQKNGG